MYNFVPITLQYAIYPCHCLISFLSKDLKWTIPLKYLLISKNNIKLQTIQNKNNTQPVTI